MGRFHTKPRSLWGALNQAWSEALVIVAIWVGVSMVMGWELPTWSELGLVALGWPIVATARYLLTRRRPANLT